MKIPLTQDDVRDLGPMPFSNTWTCTCGAKLTIRARDDRAAGDSNFRPGAKASDLTWEGLREERGWRRTGESVECPACVRGMTREAYKAMRRREQIVEQIAALKRELETL